MKLYNKIKFYIFFPVIMCVLSFQFYCTTPVSETNHKLTSYAGLSDSARYVGIQTCKECHLSIYNTFIETGMGKSFDVASRKKSAAVFDNHALVYDKTLDFYYHPFWDGDSLKVTEFRLEKKDTVYSRTETINFIVGSGQHTNSHLMNRQGYINQVPVTYFTQKGTWDLPPGFENGNNTRFGRKIGIECISCHNAYPEFVMGSENKYNKMLTGINCERCHGPGSVHVKMKKEGRLVDISKEIDYSIVNPAKLPVDLQFDVCQRCHIQGNAVLNDGKSFFDFRPGMSLSSVMNVYMPVFKGRESEHIMASHAERLKQSNCYIETIKKCNKHAVTEGAEALRPYKNSLTCVTCHNPHISVKATGPEIFNNACKNCHQERKENLCTESPALLSEQANNCVSCHMPKSGATDIPHVRVTDHRIAIPVSKKEIENVKRFVGLACINNPTPPPSSLGKAYLAWFEKFNYDKSALDSAQKYLPGKTSDELKNNFHALVHLAFLKNDYTQLLTYVRRLNDPLHILVKKSFSNEDAWCCYRIAEAFGALQMPVEGLKYYKRSIELAPFDLNFQYKYGVSLLENNQPQEAKKTFMYIISQDPYDCKALSNLGYLSLVLNEDTVSAGRYYNKALSLNPDYENALINEAGLYIYRQQFKEAVFLLKKIIKKNSGNQKAKQMLLQLGKV